MKKQSLLISVVGIFFLINGLILNVNMVFAEENSTGPDTFITNLTIVYYNEGYPIQIYAPNQTYDGVLFEINSENPEYYKIVDIGIIETVPESFINFTSLKYTELNGYEKKSLGKTPVIPVERFENNSFSIILSGVKRGTNQSIISYASVTFQGLPKEDKPFSVIGDKIWKGNSVGGLYILVFLVFVIIFIIWKYRLLDFPEMYRKKSKIKRMNGGNKNVY